MIVHVLAGLSASVIMSSALAERLLLWTPGTVPRERCAGMHYHFVIVLSWLKIESKNHLKMAVCRNYNAVLCSKLLENTE